MQRSFGAALGIAAFVLIAAGSAAAQTTFSRPGHYVTQPTQTYSTRLSVRRAPGLRDAAAPQSTIAAPLTKAECESLGGTVKEDTQHFCSSATTYCRRVDQNGNVHAVCINEQ